MDKETIDAITEQVLARIRKPTLMVLTPANGYQHEIGYQLRKWDIIHWSIFSEQSTEKELQAVGHLGNQVHWDGLNPSQWLDNYEQVLFPFLDIDTLGEIINGLYLSKASKLLQYSLMKGVPIYAFNYQCDLNSELNKVLGLSRNAVMNSINKKNLNLVRELGVNLGTAEYIERKFFNKNMIDDFEKGSLNENRYITLRDLKEKGVANYTIQDNLTDLAEDYLKAYKSRANSLN